MFDRRTVLGGLAGVLAGPRMAHAECRPLGRFSGLPSVDLLDDGRSLRLTRPFIYTARCGKVWTAPVGAISDGASIPGFLWRFVGTPLVGKYRNAAIIHDYYCARRIEEARAVHEMFYEAMLASGVSGLDALKFYYGVRIGGPSWDELTIANNRLASSDADPAALAVVARDEAAEREVATRVGAGASLASLDASATRFSTTVDGRVQQAVASTMAQRYQAAAADAATAAAAANSSDASAAPSASPP